MNLYILRHASAGTRRKNPVVDVKRPLDKEGKQQCLLVGSYLSAPNVQFDRVVSSPLKRALQTAALVANATGYDSKLEASHALTPKAGGQKSQALVPTLENYDNAPVLRPNPRIPNLPA